MILRQLRDAVGQIRDADFAGAASRMRSIQRKFMGGRYSPSGLLGRFCTVLATPIMRSTRAVVGRDFLVSDRPIHVVAIAAGGPEIDVAEAGRRAAPEIGLAADGCSARPSPSGAGSRGVGDLVLPARSRLFVIHVTDADGALRGIRSRGTSYRRAAMMAKVFPRIHVPARIERATFARPHKACGWPCRRRRPCRSR